MRFAIRPWGNDAALSPDGTQIAFVEDGLSVIDLATGEVTRRIDPFEQDFTTVSWSPDGRYLASGGWDDVAIWDAKTWKLLPRLPRYSTFALDWSWIVSPADHGRRRGHARVGDHGRQGSRDPAAAHSD